MYISPDYVKNSYNNKDNNLIKKWTKDLNRIKTSEIVASGE